MNEPQKPQIHVVDRSVKNVGFINGSVVTGGNTSIQQKDESPKAQGPQRIKLSAAQIVPALIAAVGAIIAALINFYKH